MFNKIRIREASKKSVLCVRCIILCYRNKNQIGTIKINSDLETYKTLKKEIHKNDETIDIYIYDSR